MNPSSASRACSTQMREGTRLEVVGIAGVQATSRTSVELSVSVGASTRAAAGAEQVPAAWLRSDHEAAGSSSTTFHDNWNVQIAHDEPANQIWINIVDQATGQVIMKIPPEALREAQMQPRISGGLTNFRA